MNQRRVATLLLTTLCIGCQPSARPAQIAPQTDSHSFEFALIGDNPYPPEHVPKFERLIEDVNGHKNLQWVLHVGDIRSTAQSPCSDKIIQGRFNLYQGFDAPFIFTPGDNDWFDCGTTLAGGFDETERLSFLRETFYPEPTQTTGGRTLTVETQATDPQFPAMVENALWEHHGIVFATIHLIVLTGNESTELIKMQSELMDAALAWIDRAFERATAINSPGLFLAMQADPWVVSGNPPVVNLLCEGCLAPRPGLERLYGPIAKATIAFGRPVVLATGDTHIFRVDKPLREPETGRVINNFTRVEAFGFPSVHWVHVSVSLDEREVFTIRQRVIDSNIN